MTTTLKTLPISNFHRDGTKPCHGEVFVFASNLAGDFSRGTARQALDYGAADDIVSGRHGKSYAIPTRDKDMQALSLREIAVNVQVFIEHARERFGKDRFFVTRIGSDDVLLPSAGRPDVETVLAERLDGLTEGELATLFRSAPVTCSFPESWRRFLA